jgi:acyl-CoA thioesterase
MTLTPPTSPTPQEIADHVRQGMYAQDWATQALGIRIDAVSPGKARLSMPVRQDMLNGHQICHGGLITTLADSAFAYACNSHNELTVASGFAVDFLAPAYLGDVLTATAVERSKAGRTGVYDVEVCNHTGKRLALFRGQSYTMKGKVAVGADESNTS